jgi:hypothetical protein
VVKEIYHSASARNLTILGSCGDVDRTGNLSYPVFFLPAVACLQKRPQVLSVNGNRYVGNRIEDPGVSRYEQANGLTAVTNKPALCLPFPLKLSQLSEFARENQ